ncbi:hypothetical protein PUN28_002260 [Cardiocondyla obscurior]
MEDRHDVLKREAKPTEPTKSMNISKKFLDVLELSFEAKYLSKDMKLSKKKNKLNAIVNRAEMLFDHVIDVSTNPKFDDVVALAVSFYNVGLEFVNSTDIEDLNTAIVCFSKCLELLQGKQLDRKAILTTIGALNELNLVCEKVDEKRYTYKFLNTSMELYLKYTMKDDYPDPIHIASVLGIKENESNPRILLDTLHFTTLQDLGIQYLSKPKDKHRFVIYMHKILNIRLTDMISRGMEFQENYLDWALTLYDLSKYFLANNRFIEAQNHIATADYVLYRFSEDKLKTIKKKDKSRLNYLYESYAYICAISAKSWGSYGISLLRFWMEKTPWIDEDKSREIEDVMSKLEIKSEEESNLLIFFSLKKELNCMTNQINDTCISNFAQAKSIFVTTLRHLNLAKEYFTADSDIEFHAKVILQISEAYKYLAGFEQQKDKRIKLHKRRIEFLEDVRKKFHKVINVDSELQTYKRIWYELVTSCSTIMELMLEETYHDDSFKDMSEEINRYAKLIAENIDFYLKVA